MNKRFVVSVFLALVVISVSCSGGRRAPKENGRFPVGVKISKESNKVDITVRDTPFTSLMYADSLEKPFLFPVIAASGTIITRGYPLSPRAGESVDHPHQTGFWFNYGNVNGIDFWGNSKWLTAEEKKKCGTIKLVSIDSAEGGPDKGVLKVSLEWLGPDGTIPVSERTTYIFQGGTDYRIIDRITTLRAEVPEVSFSDTKEGAFAIRVARFLEFPAISPQIHINGEGKADSQPTLNNEGVNGNYLSSEGIGGAGVWGTRGKWMMLYAVSGSDTVSIVFMDHPSNLNYPTFWHARDYGLFSANPFGQKDFTKGKEVLNFRMKEGESITFRHRLFIRSGNSLSKADIEAEWKRFSAGLQMSKSRQ